MGKAGKAGYWRAQESNKQARNHPQISKHVNTEAYEATGQHITNCTVPN